MVTPTVGLVVLVPFPFSDLSQAKLRPAVVLADGAAGHHNHRCRFSRRLTTSNEFCASRQAIHGEQQSHGDASRQPQRRSSEERCRSGHQHPADRTQAIAYPPPNRAMKPTPCADARLRCARPIGMGPQLGGAAYRAAR